MAIDFLLILLLHAKDYLRRNNTFVRVFEVKVGIQSERCSVLEDMGSDRLFVNGAFHESIRLVDTKQG